MKKTSAIRTALVILTVVFCVQCAGLTAFAGSSTEGTYQYQGNESELKERLLQVRSFKFWVHDGGIGYGNCPVYTAPSEDAYRCADGKASCQTSSTMDEAGFFSGWLLVRYQTNNGGSRVGYIPPKYVKGFNSKMGTPQFDYIPATAADTIYVTDNTGLPGSSFAYLDPGEQFFILAKYTYVGDWWYIECQVDGKTARGFIDRNSSSFNLGNSGSAAGSESGSGPDSGLQEQTYMFEGGITSTGDLGYPSKSPIGTELIGTVLISAGNTGDRKMVRKNRDPNSDVVSAVYPGNVYPCYAVMTGSTHKDWYYIFVEEDSAWGWVSSSFATLQPLGESEGYEAPAEDGEGGEPIGYAEPEEQGDAWVFPTDGSSGEKKKAVPERSPLGTTQIGEVTISGGQTGDRKIVRQNRDPDSAQVAVVYPGSTHPCYAEQQGSTHKPWYYIWVEEADAWGWVSSSFASLTE